jgi:hypothetical protein
MSVDLLISDAAEVPCGGSEENPFNIRAHGMNPSRRPDGTGFLSGSTARPCLRANKVIAPGGPVKIQNRVEL